MADISVVVPTAGKRPAQLREALRSVAAQEDCGSIEVIIVDDSDGRFAIEDVANVTSGLDVRVISAAAEPTKAQRQLGVLNASAEWIAFLDDDDRWEPRKLAAQLRIARSLADAGRLAVVACRVRHTFDHSDRVVENVPARLIAPCEDVSDYLFYRRTVSTRRESVFTSTLFVARELAVAVPWRRLARHQDWDWLLRAALHRRATVQHHPDQLATVHVGSAGSISASANWEQSLNWAVNARSEGLLTRRAFGDFLAGQTLRYAITARSSTGIQRTLSAILGARRLPSARALLIGVAGLLPRHKLQQAMTLRPRGAAANASRP